MCSSDLRRAHLDDLHRLLEAHQHRPEQGAAAGFSSPLSLPYLLDSFVPQIEAAVDGDPATTP